MQLKNTELEDKIAYLEKELESVSTSALEMHTLLENSLATQANSELTRNEVEELHMLTEKQENQIIELRDEMDSILLVVIMKLLYSLSLDYIYTVPIGLCKIFLFLERFVKRKQ